MKKIKGIIVAILTILVIPVFWACQKESNLLKTPQNVSLDETTNVLWWDLVEDAEYYGVDINGKIHQTRTNSLDISEYIEDSGTYLIKVKAFAITDGKKVSKYSEPITINKKARLASPNLVFNDATGELSWEEVENASYYIMYINGVYYNTTEHSFNLYGPTPFDNYLIRGQENTFKVYCAPTSNYTNSQFSRDISAYIANMQQTPQNVKLEIIDGLYLLSFDPVSTAREYEITLGNLPISTQSTELYLNTFLRSFGLKTVTVQANKVEDENGKVLYMKSPKSQAIEFEYKPAFVEDSVQNIQIDNEKVLTFDEVLDAENYEITIDDQTFTTNTNQYNLADIITEGKQYEISVVAVNGNYKSHAGIIEYDNILKLETPNFEFVEPETSRLTERHISIITTYNIPVAYKVYFAGGHIETRQSQNIDITDYLELGENTISVQVVCDNEFYLDSEMATKTYQYYLPAMPTNLEISEQKVLTFTGTESTTETYKIYIKLQNQQWGEPVLTTAETTIDLQTYLVGTGKYNIGVSSFDDNIESQKSVINYVIYEQLATPQNLVAQQESDGRALLSFNAVQNASGYELYIDGVQKCQLDSNQFNDITTYVNVGSDTNITVKAVGDGEVYLASAISNTCVFRYIMQLDQIEDAFVVASSGKYYLYFAPVEYVDSFELTITFDDNDIVKEIDDRYFDDYDEMYFVDIDENITQTGDYQITISPNVDDDYYIYSTYQYTETLKIYNQSDYSSKSFFYYGKYYTYSVNNEFELGEAVLHAMLYRKDSIEVYLNYNYDGIEDAYTATYCPIQDCLPLINNFGVDLDNTSNIFLQLFTGSGSLQDKIYLIERAHDQMYLYITGESRLTSQKSNRVYTIDFDYSNAGKYQADESNLQGAAPSYVGQTTSKTFPIDSYDEVEVETAYQLIMVAAYGKKPKFINQDDSSLNHIAEDTYNAARYVLSQICTDGMTEVQIVKAIHDWIVLNNTYDYSTYENASGTPFNPENLNDMGFFASGTLLKNLSVCAGYAQTFSLMCGIMGIRSATTLGLVGSGISWASVDFNNFLSLLLSGLLTNSGNIGAHSWNRVYISTPQHPEKAWYIVDCTWDDWDDGDYISYDYFLKTDYDDDISSSRKELYPYGTYYHEKNEYGVEIDYEAYTEYNM